MATKDMFGGGDKPGDKAEQGKPSGEDSRPSPAERRRLFVNAMAHYMAKVEGLDAALAQERAEAWVENGVNNGKIDLFKLPGDEEADALEEADAYELRTQYGIQVLALMEGGVEITQEGQHGPDEATVIDIMPGNEVRVALAILAAAGFKNITITTRCDDGEEELKPGSTAADFTWSPPKPPAPPAPKPTVVPAVAPKPAADEEEENTFRWREKDGDLSSDVVIMDQPATAIYWNGDNNLAIRQAARDYGDDDDLIVVTRNNIDSFMKSLTGLVGERKG